MKITTNSVFSFSFSFTVALFSAGIGTVEAVKHCQITQLQHGYYKHPFRVHINTTNVFSNGSLQDIDYKHPATSPVEGILANVTIVDLNSVNSSTIFAAMDVEGVPDVFAVGEKVNGTIGLTLPAVIPPGDAYVFRLTLLSRDKFCYLDTHKFTVVNVNATALQSPPPCFVPGALVCNDDASGFQECIQQDSTDTVFGLSDTILCAETTVCIQETSTTVSCQSPFVSSTSKVTTTVETTEAMSSTTTAVETTEAVSSATATLSIETTEAVSSATATATLSIETTEAVSSTTTAVETTEAVSSTATAIETTVAVSSTTTAVETTEAVSSTATAIETTVAVSTTTTSSTTLTIPTPNPSCTTAGASVCFNSTFVEYCIPGPDGILVFSDAVACETTCDEASANDCVPDSALTNGDQCVLGTSECIGTFNSRLCILNNNGVAVWSTAALCDIGLVCDTVSGLCNGTCTPQTQMCYTQFSATLFGDCIDKDPSTGIFTATIFNCTEPNFYCIDQSDGIVACELITSGGSR